MAARNPSMFLYGFQITENNRSLDFKAASGGPAIMATLKVGFYSLTSLLVEVKRALTAADPNNNYTVTADRTINGGQENRVTISTSGAYLSLLFATGTRTDSNCAAALGFSVVDRTGGTSYTSNGTSGTRVVSFYPGHNYLPPAYYKKNFGTVNVTASGRKEAIVYSTQRFWQIQFKYVPESSISAWADLMTWLIAQRPIEFTPSVADPGTIYEGTLESTSGDSNGLGFQFTEMLSQGMPFYYDIGLLKFRVRE